MTRRRREARLHPVDPGRHSDGRDMVSATWGAMGASPFPAPLSSLPSLLPAPRMSPLDLPAPGAGTPASPRGLPRPAAYTGPPVPACVHRRPDHDHLLGFRGHRRVLRPPRRRGARSLSHAAEAPAAPSGYALRLPAGGPRSGPHPPCRSGRPAVAPTERPAVPFRFPPVDPPADPPRAAGARRSPRRADAPFLGVRTSTTREQSLTFAEFGDRRRQRGGAARRGPRGRAPRVLVQGAPGPGLRGRAVRRGAGERDPRPARRPDDARHGRPDLGADGAVRDPAGHRRDDRAGDDPAPRRPAGPRPRRPRRSRRPRARRGARRAGARGARTSRSRSCARRARPATRRASR